MLMVLKLNLHNLKICMHLNLLHNHLRYKKKKILLHLYITHKGKTRTPLLYRILFQIITTIIYHIFIEIDHKHFYNNNKKKKKGYLLCPTRVIYIYYTLYQGAQAFCIIQYYSTLFYSIYLSLFFLLLYTLKT